MSQHEQLIEAVTRRVLAQLAGGEGRCAECVGDCAACCPDKVRSVVAVGATRVSYGGNGGEVPSDLAGFIDHTLLKPEATPEDVDRLCDEALKYGFVAVCVNPVWVARAAKKLRGSGVTVASVVGFPLGAATPQVKAFEARRALRDGAREIDMVLNVGALKGGHLDLVERDIRGVSDACREVGALNKVILETALLSDEEKVVASRIAKRAKANYVKTSTGFGPAGATVYDVALMREAVGAELGVKASGGIRTAEEAQDMIDAGATRIGASAGIQMVTGQGNENAKGGAEGGRY